MAKVRVVLSHLLDVQRTRKFPIYGPSLTNEWAYTELGDISAFVDAGNLHNYFAGRHPGTGGWGANGYGSLAWHLRLVKGNTGNKASVTTETGYSGDVAASDAVPDSVAARYIPRLLLEQFRAGIARTFLYQLVDEGTGQYGLLRWDGIPSRRYRLEEPPERVGDPGAGGGPQVTRLPLAERAPNLRHMALQKRDVYYLALWLERSSYDVDRRLVLPTASARVTVTVLPSHQIVFALTWQSNGTTERSALSRTPTETLTVSDDLKLLEVAPVGR